MIQFSERIRVIILDFDGVVVESNDIKDKVFQEIFSRYPEQYDEAWSYHRTHISLSRYRKFEYLLSLIGEQGNTVLLDQLTDDFSAATIEKMRLVPFVAGAREFLDKMRHKKPLYLASVTPIDDLLAVVDHLQIRSYFKYIYGCPPWTKPGAVKDILEKEKIEPANAVLIGDSYGDQRAALETGVHFIGRNSGLGFEDPQPGFVVNDLTGMAAIFTN